MSLTASSEGLELTQLGVNHGGEDTVVAREDADEDRIIKAVAVSFALNISSDSDVVFSMEGSLNRGSPTNVSPTSGNGDSEDGNDNLDIHRWDAFLDHDHTNAMIYQEFHGIDQTERYDGGLLWRQDQTLRMSSEVFTDTSSQNPTYTVTVFWEPA